MSAISTLRQPQSLSKAEIIAEATTQATERVRAQIADDLTAQEARIIEVTTRQAVTEAVDRIAAQADLIAGRAFWRGVSIAGVGGLVAGILASTVWFGTVGHTQGQLATESVTAGAILGRAENQQDELRTMATGEEVQPGARETDPDRDRGCVRLANGKRECGR